MRGRWTVHISNVRRKVEGDRHTLVAVVTEVRHLGDTFEDQLTQKADCAMKMIRAPRMLRSDGMDRTFGEFGAWSWPEMRRK